MSIHEIPQLTPDMPCVCASGKSLRECCAIPGGGLRKVIPIITPSGSQTGYSHRKCYLRATEDCSRKISGEHFMSKCALAVLGDVVAVGGAPWLAADEVRNIGIRSLTGNILCVRHNSALDPLDSVGGEFLRRLLDIHIDMKSPAEGPNSIWMLSGEALERWMLKAALGFFYSKNATRNGARLADDHEVDERLALPALLSGVWNHGCGLYMGGEKGNTFKTANSIQIAALTSSREKKVVGARLIIAGLWFDLVFDNSSFEQEWYQQGWVHRPAELLFENGRRWHRIWLSWWPVISKGISSTLSYPGSPSLTAQNHP